MRTNSPYVQSFPLPFTTINRTPSRPFYTPSPPTSALAGYPGYKIYTVDPRKTQVLPIDNKLEEEVLSLLGLIAFFNFSVGRKK
jgi:hypothetical protein